MASDEDEILGCLGCLVGVVVRVLFVLGMLGMAWHFCKWHGRFERSEHGIGLRHSRGL